MGRISLEIARSLHQPSLAAGDSLPVVRLLSDLSLRTPNGWTPPFKVVMDTGATVSLLPKTIWQDEIYHSIARVTTAGVINKPECTISATLATVECALMHGSEQIGP